MIIQNIPVLESLKVLVCVQSCRTVSLLKWHKLFRFNGQHNIWNNVYSSTLITYFLWWFRQRGLLTLPELPLLYSILWNSTFMRIRTLFYMNEHSTLILYLSFPYNRFLSQNLCLDCISGSQTISHTSTGIVMIQAQETGTRWLRPRLSFTMWYKTIILV